MKLTKEDIKNFATEDEQKLLEIRKYSSSPYKKPTNLLYLVFKSTQYVEDFEKSFLGAFTNDKKAYRAAEAYFRKRKKSSKGPYGYFIIYQVTMNDDLGLGNFLDVTDDLEDFYADGGDFYMGPDYHNPREK